MAHLSGISQDFVQPGFARCLPVPGCELQSGEVYARCMKYLTGCADLFRAGHIDVNQFTLDK